MKKHLILTLTLGTCVLAFSPTCEAGFISTLKDKIKAALGSDKVSPKDAVLRLDAIIKAQKNIQDLGQINEQYGQTAQSMEKQRQTIYNEHKGDLQKLDRDVQEMLKNIQEKVQKEVDLLKAQQTRNQEELDGKDGSIRMWLAIKGASTLMADEKSNIGHIANYIQALAQKSETNLKKEKVTLGDKLEVMEKDLKSIENSLKNPSAITKTQSEKLSKSLDELRDLQGKMKEIQSFIEKLLVAQESGLKDFAQQTAGAAKTAQASLEALVKASKCAKVTTWTKAVTPLSSGAYRVSDDFQACKFAYVDIAKENKDARCSSLGSTSTDDQIMACVNAVK